eukprot:sb/3473929/
MNGMNSLNNFANSNYSGSGERKRPAGIGSGNNNNNNNNKSSSNGTSSTTFKKYVPTNELAKQGKIGQGFYTGANKGTNNELLLLMINNNGLPCTSGDLPETSPSDVPAEDWAPGACQRYDAPPRMSYTCQKTVLELSLSHGGPV